MKFGTFHILPMPEGATAHGVIHETLTEVELAEALGFDTVWLAEHHSSRHGLCPSASVLGAAVAMRTRRVNIGYAVNVTPLHHPLRLAEEIAFVDQLSDGRVMLGSVPVMRRTSSTSTGCRWQSGTTVTGRAWRWC